MRKRSGQVHSRESSATLQLTVSLLYQKPHLGFVKRNKKVIMMEKTLILKHISGMLCLLISYSKFTRTETEGALIAPKKYDTINYQDYVLY